MKKRFVYAAGNALLTILVLLLIGYGWAFIELKIMLKSQPELFGYVFYQVKDDEMVPDFNIDDIVIIKRDAPVNVGDKVFLLDGSKYKLTNVVYMGSDTITTKCTMCPNNYDAISESTIIGKAIGKIAYFGKFINFFKQKWLLSLLAVFGFTCIISSQYMRVENDTKKS